jgi:hypothetical protein
MAIFLNYYPQISSTLDGKPDQIILRRVIGFRKVALGKLASDLTLFRPKGSRSGARQPTAAGIEARRLDLHDPKQCRQLPSAPVLDAATGAAMRTFPPMLTISIGLSLNQLGLHGGKKGFALVQS